MPPKNKKQGVNQNDKRHDNGLIQPGKRVTKSTSNGALNGNVNEKSSTSSTPPSATSAAHAPDPSPETETHDDTNGNSAGSQIAMAGQKSVENLRDSRLERHSSGVVETQASEGQERVSAASQDLDNTGSKQDYSASTAFAERAATVIGPHTLRDVIAILLLLLQLPPKVLMFIQVCFVSLTLGSGSSGWSLANLITSPDWFQSHGGNPSFLTTITADIVFLIVWFILPIGKDLTLDLAQVYIAMSLGGGVTGEGGTPGVICMGILGLSHVLRYKPSRDYTANIVWNLMSKADFGPFKGTASLPILIGAAYDPHSWPRALVEIHIISQGIVRIIRRAVYRRQEPRSKNGKRMDSEAMTRATSILFPSDIAADGARSGSTDNRPPGPSPAVRDGKEKSVSSGKKRRKQATFVRSQQPFWAAIANTKITVSKELEHSQATRDAYEAEASNAKQLGDAVVKPFEDRVWISQIEDTEITYSASFVNEPEWNDEAGQYLAPVRVRVNNAPWKSTMCWPVDQGDGRVTDGKYLLRGTIAGLTAASNLVIEFIRDGDGEVLYSASVVTRPIANSEQGITIAPQPQEALGPSSPTTTLRNAIAAAELRVNEVKERIKKTRKAHRTATAALQSTNENLENRMSSVGGNDEKQKQRQIQYNSSIRLAEDEVAKITAQIEELGEIPEQDRENAARSEELWNQESKCIAALREESDNFKAETDRQVGAAQAANKATHQKRERLQARLNRLVAQRAALSAVNEQTRADRVKRDQDHAHKIAGRAKQEQMVLNNILHIEYEVQDMHARMASLEQNPYLYWDTQNYAVPPSYTQQFHERNGSLPLSPDAAYQGIVSGVRAPPGLGGLASSSLNYRTGTPPIASISRRGSIRQCKTRARSSSMLSEISGFTEEDDTSAQPEAPSRLSVQSPPFAPNGGSAYFGASYATAAQDIVDVGKRGEGNGSGSGSGSGSGNLTRRGSEQDATSPGLRGLNQSPITTEVRRGSPRNWGC